MFFRKGLAGYFSSIKALAHGCKIRKRVGMDIFLRWTVLLMVCFLTACGDGSHSGPNEKLLAGVVSVSAAAVAPNPVVTFTGVRSNYTITRTGYGYSVKDNVGNGGTSLVTLANSIQFADASVNLLIGDKSKTISAAQLKFLIELYVAFFNRVPDADGLSYWIDQVAAGVSTDRIADGFYAAAIQFSTQTGYSASMSDSDFVRIIYKNVLGRTGTLAPPDADVQYWASRLASGASTKGGLVVVMLNSAHTFAGDPVWGWVPQLLDNKDSVATYFSVQQGLTYSGSDALAKSMAIAAAVTSASTSQAKAMIASNDSAFDLTGANTTAVQSFNPPAAAAVPTAVTSQLANLIGSYQRLPVQNGAHTGTISFQPGSTTLLQWKNNLGWTLNLTPDLANNVLKTDNTNPYQNIFAPNFTLAYQGDVLVGFYFIGELYQLAGVKTVTAVQQGMHGYLSYYTDSETPAKYGSGFSLYSAIWPLIDRPINGFQVGTGTWLLPRVADNTKALLPPDNPMRMQSPERGPTWGTVYETIEGGSGYWLSSQFPTREPKFKINGTYDGYNHELATPGWGFQYAGGTPNALSRDVMGIAQLSNRLLIPPDGITFRKGTSGQFLGYAYMALPLTAAKPNLAVPVGDQSWTLFFNAINFSGPVAFWVPDVFTRLAQTWSNDIGTGLDVMPGFTGPGAMEINIVPGFENADAKGVMYSRAARLLFPTDAAGITYMIADWKTYSADALYAPMKAWINGGAPFAGTFAPGNSFSSTVFPGGLNFVADGGKTVSGMEDYVNPAVVKTPGGGIAVGLRWTGKGTPGVFPEYFQQNGTGVKVVSADQVPAETKLSTVNFPYSTRDGAFTSPSSGAASWNSPAPQSAPLTALLVDGTQVSYAWYRFIDQPSLQGFGWTADEKQRLQAVVEKIHTNWSSTREFMAPPTVGDLVGLDDALIVTPPPGMEIGYVPIVIKQVRANP
jgi:hypothetical protein